MRKIRDYSTISLSLLVASLVITLAFSFIALTPNHSLAWNGGGHYWATEAAVGLFGVRDIVEPIETLMTPDMIDRNREVPLLPELEGVNED